MMNIVIDLTSLADNFSGIERYALNISLNIVEHAEHNFILVFKHEVHRCFQLMSNRQNIRFVVLPRCNKLAFNMFRLPKALKRIEADCYLFLAFPAPIFFNKNNMVVTMHDLCCWDCPETMTVKSKVYFKSAFKHALKKSKKIITISEFSKKRIIEQFNYPESEIILAYCGLDENFVKYQKSQFRLNAIDNKYGLPQNYILSLSTIEPRKNLKLLLKSYQLLVKGNKNIYDLVLAGRAGWKMNNLLDDLDDETKRKIHFTGFIDDIDLPYVYGNAELFVFPSKYEGFGLPPLEAMACGSLVVSSDAASLPEVLGDAAIYFENNNSESLTEKLLFALSIEKNEREELIRKGQEQVKKFSWVEESESLLYGLISLIGN